MTSQGLGADGSFISLSSKSEGSIPAARKWLNPPLHERCTMADMEKLRVVFTEAFMNRLMPEEFRSTLRDLLNIEYDDDEFNILFLKINTNRNGEIVWDELVTHLLLGYFGNDPENQRETLEPPIIGIPRVFRSMHRHPISRITFCPDVDKFRRTDWMIGNYITASRDGMINWWSLNMDLLRTGYSASPHLKVRQTWVTDMVCMPDVNIIVTSSTERELRFYDTGATTFTLKIIITSWEFMICTMHYHFHKDENEQSMLLCGDVGGNVRVLLFSPIQRGPFQSQAAKALIQLRHVDLQKRPELLPLLKLVEIRRVHNEWVRQVSFYASLHCVVSCATCPDSLLMTDIYGSKTHNMFHTEKGIQCFVFDEEAHTLVTGGPDCTVRVWNPFVPAKPSLVLTGHHAGIVALVLQNSGQTIYSLSRDRVLKVWDVQLQCCIQNYIDIPAIVGERTPLSAVYNPATRDFIIGAVKIAMLVLDEQLNPKHTDGYTHARAVSKILYNTLFKVVITCGMGSIIINWNPKTGKRNVMIRDAHTRVLHGEELPVEITAACFDPGHQLLLTGARDGTLKVWNFNNGACMRNMNVEKDQEITGVFWIEGRIFTIGWNRHVTEFEDSGTAATGKAWETRHTDDVLAAAARSPLSLATASYNSELIFWKLETGQPYRRFSCTEPTLRIKMVYNRRETRAASKPSTDGGQRKSTFGQRKSVSTSASRKSVTGDDTARRQSSVRRPSCMQKSGDSVIDSAAAMAKAHTRRVSQVAMPSRIMNIRKLAIHAMIFLETRPFSMHVASLMVAVENGQIQAWSDHPAGGFKGSFQGIHTAGDYVAAFASDVNNDYLFTGTTIGYIKVWLMKNYLVNQHVHVNMPALRVEFPFMWKDRIEGRAKRSVRDQPRPLLLNSYRGHLRCITTMVYIDEQKMLLSGSSDYSVRMWRLSGEYLQTLGGGLVPWSLEVTRFPPDVAKVASFTTFKVWRGGYVNRFVPGQKEIDLLADITEVELRGRVYGKPAEDPILGRYFELPKRPDPQDSIQLDDSLPTIPLYNHLRMASTVPVRRPATPPLVRETRLKKERQEQKKLHFGGTSVSNLANPQRASNAQLASGGRASNAQLAGARTSNAQAAGQRPSNAQASGHRTSADKQPPPPNK